MLFFFRNGDKAQASGGALQQERWLQSSTKVPVVVTASLVLGLVIFPPLTFNVIGGFVNAAERGAISQRLVVLGTELGTISPPVWAVDVD